MRDGAHPAASLVLASLDEAVGGVRQRQAAHKEEESRHRCKAQGQSPAQVWPKIIHACHSTALLSCVPFLIELLQACMQKAVKSMFERTQ